jgi:hypothetical protein
MQIPSYFLPLLIALDLQTNYLKLYRQLGFIVLFTFGCAATMSKSTLPCTVSQQAFGHGRGRCVRLNYSLLKLKFTSSISIKLVTG